MCELNSPSFHETLLHNCTSVYIRKNWNKLHKAIINWQFLSLNTTLIQHSLEAQLFFEVWVQSSYMYIPNLSIHYTAIQLTNNLFWNLSMK